MYKFTGEPNEVPQPDEQKAITEMIEALKKALLEHCKANPEHDYAFLIGLAISLFTAHMLADIHELQGPVALDAKDRPVLLIPTSMATLFNTLQARGIKTVSTYEGDGRFAARVPLTKKGWSN